MANHLRQDILIKIRVLEIQGITLLALATRHNHSYQLFLPRRGTQPPFLFEQMINNDPNVIYGKNF